MHEDIGLIFLAETKKIIQNSKHATKKIILQCDPLFI